MYYASTKILTKYRRLPIQRLRLLVCELCLALTFYSSVNFAETPSDDIAIHYRFDEIAPDILRPKGPQRAIIQDADGYMWFGGYDGLMRFDGHDFLHFSHNEKDTTSLSSTKVTTLEVDETGTLWVGTTYGLNRYEPDSQSFTRFLNPAKEPLATKLNGIFTLAVGDNGAIWMASATASLSKFNSTTERYEDIPRDKNNACNLVFEGALALLNDRGKGLWIGTTTAQICFLDYKTQEFTAYALNNSNEQEKYLRGAEEIVKDHLGYVWVATKEGVVRLEPNSGAVKRYRAEDQQANLKSSIFLDIDTDSQGNIWAASEDGGLSLYLREEDRFVTFMHDPSNPNSLPTNKIWTIYRSKNDDLWFSHYPNGISKLDPYSIAFKNYTANMGALSLSHNEVLTVLEDNDERFWIGTENGLTLLDFKQRQSTFFRHRKDDPDSIPANAVISLFIDSTEVMWLGTWGGGLCWFNRLSGQCKPFKPDHPQLKTTSVNQIIEDTRGEIWLASSNGLFRYNRKTDSVIHYTSSKEEDNSLAGDYLSAVLEDHLGNLWIGTSNGLDLFDRDRNLFIHHKPIDEDPRSLPENQIRALAEDHDGNLWIGSWGGGLSRYNRDSAHFTNYTTEDGLPNESVLGIAIEDDGSIWLSTHDGLSQFNPLTLSFRNFGKEHGLAGTVFPRQAIISAKSGKIFAGGTHGLTVFNPEVIYKNKFVPQIQLTNFYLFSQKVNFREEDSPLTMPIERANLITLNHLQSVFAFDFVVLNYKITARNRFKYRLLGFEENWQESGTRRTATYTNLDPGDYQFQVIGSNNDGLWNNQETSITIRILPPWWFSWWAYTLYFLATIAALASFVYSQKQKRLRVEEQNKKLVRLDKLKDDFIANTSHELRTPLNGIIGLADSLLEGAAGEINQQMSINLKMISASGKRLANLVNDILDFSKLKNRNIGINAQPVDLNSVAQFVINMCAHTVSKSAVNIINNIPQELETVLADEERLQQILYNLVGNALKFTERGSVILSCRNEPEFIWVDITDTGIGIPSDCLEKIFNSFEQLEDHQDRSYGGTGLGLAVTKQLVQLHGGAIQVSSKEGSGSCFSFSLLKASKKPAPRMTAMNYEHSIDSGPYQTLLIEPVNTTHQNAESAAFIESELAPINVSTTNVSTINKDDSDSQIVHDALNNENYKILIVDDNPINRQVVANQLLLHRYQIVMASDGASALQAIKDQGPIDLVLLDIMMPKMSGYEVCAQLRKSHPIEDLPIIFLTAKNTIEDLVDGFEVGANDFLTKPISIGELNSRVKTHLQLLKFNRSLERLVEARTNEVVLLNNQLKTLDRIATIISQEIRIDRLLSVILHDTKNLFPDLTEVVYWNKEKAHSAFVKVHAEMISGNPHILTSIELSTIEKTFLNEDAKLSNCIYLHNDPDNLQQIASVSGVSKPGSLLCLTFDIENDSAGLLILSSQNAESSFSSSQAINYERLRIHINSALANVRLVEKLEQQCTELERMSFTDQLTGLHNRRFLSKCIDQDISIIHRIRFNVPPNEVKLPTHNDSNLLFILIDLDHFKQKNDNFGHDAGDRILAQIHLVFDKVLRSSDYRIRWGGEEFLIVARFCKRDNATNLMEQLRATMAAFPFDIGDGKTVQMTCSIGFACYPFIENDITALSWSQVINVADHALYAVKNSQRNGWLGFYGTEGPMENSFIAKIMANPEKMASEGKLIIHTNLSDIHWPANNDHDED
jgi:diguanylate cyclase (GGDEF)-like protein